jgi:hypothetical protein
LFLRHGIRFLSGGRLCRRLPLDYRLGLHGRMRAVARRDVVSQALAYDERYVLVDRAGMGLLLLDPKLGEHV